MKTGIETELIKMKNLYFSYENGEEILHNLNFTAFRGESIGLIGANGVGKSTFLKILVGLNTGFEGSLEIGHHVMNKENLAHIREHIGYVFQDSDAQMFMTTVEDDIAFGPRNYGLSEAEVEERVAEALKKTHIEHLRQKAVYKLSGGEKKLAAIATILAMEPDIILMDEPSVALDPKNRRYLINLLNEMPITKLVASHDLDFILDTCSRVIFMYNGSIIADDKAENILTNKAFLEAFGMELPLRYQK